ncbi:MAG: phenylalanine--tRNA ligase subunit beta [Firmicutes bacterium]|nr:phenylalanine--tRNA ligase subunit beta [Bacillota bacterium]
MKVPLSWLKDYVDIDISAAELAAKLTAVGVVAETVTYVAPEVSGVYAGKILTIKKHPNADKLVIADVDTGSETLQIVTGAKNVREGHTVPVALHGAKLTEGLKIKKGKIRGEESNGMMCSAKELGLELKDLPADQREGVMVLPDDTPAGSDISKLWCLNDPILEFETFANRPDQLSILGIAREAAAVLGKKIKMPSIEFSEVEQKASDLVKVEIEDLKLCPRYSARIIKDAHIRKAPLWMQGRLYAAGVRSINIIVDITNYVMLETGQPLHAFDFDKVSGGRIIVRPAKPGETIVSLDGEKRELDSDILVIADAEKPVAIAGVMGGQDSEVTDDTKVILLEAANFNQASVRRTSIRQKLPSESSKRFEKGIDYHRVDFASQRACKLFAEYGGIILAGESSCGIEPPAPVKITLRPSRLNRILGTEIDRATIGKLLNGLDFETEDQGEDFIVTVPTVRKDIGEEVDLIEEVARLWGYDNIPTTEPEGISIGFTAPMASFEDYIRSFLTRCELMETVTLTLQDEAVLERYGIDGSNLLRVANPVTSDQKLMRFDAVPHLVDVVKRNMSSRRFEFKLFEISKFYTDKGGENEPDERRELTLLASASAAKSTEYDFFTLKGIIESLCKDLGITVELKRSEYIYLHPGKSAEIIAQTPEGEVSLGVMGAIHPKIAAAEDVDQEVFVAKVSVDKLFALKQRKEFAEIPRFPAIERDIAVVVDRKLPAGEVESIIRNEGMPLLGSTYCFDVYTGKQVPEEKKSLAFKLYFSAPDRTLTDEEVQSKMDSILKKLDAEYGAALRS